MTVHARAPGPPSAAIVGAGLAGLTAAWRLHCHGWRVSVFEASDRVGGRVQTIEREGYRIDTGASVLSHRHRPYLKLAGEVGLGADLALVPPIVGIARDGRLHHLRTDRILRALLATRLVSPRSKWALLRLALDVALAKWRGLLDRSDVGRAAPLDDCTARDYALRSLTAELEAHVCDPIARMILLLDGRNVSRVELYSAVATPSSGRVYALRGGQGRLAQALARSLDPQLRCCVRQVRDDGHAIQLTYQRRGDPAPITARFDACVVACPLPHAAEICLDQRAVLALLGQAVRYTQAITVAVATRRPPSSPAFLLQIPSCENADLAVMFLEHNKCVDRAPPGSGLIGVAWEAEASRRWFDAPDADIGEHTVRGVLALMPELRDEIAFTHVTRWPLALPWKQVGAYRLVSQFGKALDPDGRLQLDADYLSDAGQHTAVEFGERAAARLLARFGVG